MPVISWIWIIIHDGQGMAWVFRGWSKFFNVTNVPTFHDRNFLVMPIPSPWSVVTTAFTLHPWLFWILETKDGRQMQGTRPSPVARCNTYWASHRRPSIGEMMMWILLTGCGVLDCLSYDVFIIDGMCSSGLLILRCAYYWWDSKGVRRNKEESAWLLRRFGNHLRLGRVAAHLSNVRIDHILSFLSLQGIIKSLWGKQSNAWCATEAIRKPMIFRKTKWSKKTMLYRFRFV